MNPSLEPPYAHDPRGMGGFIEGIPEQIEAALDRMHA
jgi:hypothetical protein